MRAVVWNGRRDVRVEEVADPVIQDPTTPSSRSRTSICGSDLHLYEAMGAVHDAGDILGHEAMGVVVEVGGGSPTIAPGDRVVIPFNISCGTCFMCEHGLQSQCETTQVRDQGNGAALFGYTKLYGRCPAGRRSTSGCRRRTTAPSRCPTARPTTGSSTCPTCCPRHGRPSSTPTPEPDGTLLVLGLGPIGDMACRIALHRGVRR